MAKLIKWEDIEPGMTVWEEWIAGTGTVRATVLENVSPTVKRIHYTLSTGVEFTQETRKEAQFRYWDQEPTLEEREFTGWGMMAP